MKMISLLTISISLKLFSIASTHLSLKMEKKTREDKWNDEKAEWLTTVEEPI